MRAPAALSRPIVNVALSNRSDSAGPGRGEDVMATLRRGDWFPASGLNSMRDLLRGFSDASPAVTLGLTARDHGADSLAPDHRCDHHSRLAPAVFAGIR